MAHCRRVFSFNAGSLFSDLLPLLLPQRRLSWLPGQSLFLCVRDPQPIQTGCHRCCVPMLMAGCEIACCFFSKTACWYWSCYDRTFCCLWKFSASTFCPAISSSITFRRSAPALISSQLILSGGVCGCVLAHNRSSLGGTVIVHRTLDFIPHLLESLCRVVPCPTLYVSSQLCVP